MRLAWTLGACLAALVSTRSASAQDAPPPPPPPGAAPYGAAPYGATPYGAPPPYGAQPYGAPVPYGQPGVYYAQPAGPRVMDYEEGQPVPEGYRVETRARRGLIIGGAVTFGTTYLLSALFGGLLESTDKAFGGTGESYTPLYIPVAGPFVTIGTANAEGGGIFVLMLDGIAQAGGVAMLIGGIASPATKLVRNDVAVSVQPMVVGKGTLGVGVSGTL